MQDFRKTSQVASNITRFGRPPAPYVFVVKKNKSVLNALQLGWTAGQEPSGKLDLPLLLLDDESDYASVNTRRGRRPDGHQRGDPGHPRQVHTQLLPRLHRDALREHLHRPRQRERSVSARLRLRLETPTNYVGASRPSAPADDVLEAAVMDLVGRRRLTSRHGHKSGDSVSRASRRACTMAIRTFFSRTRSATSAATAAGRSMLINVSRFKNVQRQVLSSSSSEVHRRAAQCGRLPRDGLRRRDAQCTPRHPRGDLPRAYPDVGVAWEEVLEPLCVTRWPTSASSCYNSDRDKSSDRATRRRGTSRRG